MGHLSPRVAGRRRRQARIRKKVIGIPDRPRVCISRSSQHLYAQVVDDLARKTLVGRSTQDKSLRESAKPQAAAEALGKLLAAEMAKQGITQVVFDRGGYKYHGRVRVFADALRAGGLKF